MRNARAAEGVAGRVGAAAATGRARVAATARATAGAAGAVEAAGAGDGSTVKKSRFTQQLLIRSFVSYRRLETPAGQNGTSAVGTASSAVHSVGTLSFRPISLPSQAQNVGAQTAPADHTGRPLR